MVKCELCQIEKKDLTKHIIKIHKILTRKYREMFPDALLMESDLRPKASENMQRYNFMHRPWNEGKPWSEETKKVISEARKGKGIAKLFEKVCLHCDETFIVQKRELRHKFCSKRCSYNDRMGREISEEHKQKISFFQKGKPKSEEQKKKIKESNKNQKRDIKSKKNISDSAKIRANTDDGKNKLKEAGRNGRIAQLSIERTIPELIMRKLLTELNISFEEQKSFGFFFPDFIIEDKKLIILVDGDYWHGNKLTVWKDKEYDEAMIRRKKTDELAVNFYKEEGFKVIRFWESELKENYANCKNILEQEIIN